MNDFDNIQIDKTSFSYLDLLSQSDNVPLKVGTATAAAHAVRADQLSANLTNFPIYSEGAWTPIFGAAGYVFTQVTQVGQYVKIGNLVIYKLFLKVTFVSGSGAVFGSISGLPFTSSSSMANLGGCSMFPDTGASLFASVASARPNPSSSSLTVGQGFAGSGLTGVNWAAMATGTEFEVSGHYFV